MPAGPPGIATLLAAGDVDERLALLLAGRDLDGSDLSWLMDEAEELVLRDPAGSEQLVSLVRAAEAERPDLVWDESAAVRARSDYLLARIRATQGRPQQALELIARSRETWLEAHNPLAALRTDVGRAQVLNDLGRHTDAVSVGTELVAALDRLPAEGDEQQRTRERIRAHAMDNLGAAYGYTGRHAQALRCYAESESSYCRLQMTMERARPQANRAVELIALGRPREALAELRAAHATFDAGGDRLFAAQCDADMATAHRQLGRFSDALVLLERGRQTLDDLGAHAEADRLRLALAEVYLSLGLLAEARAEAQESAERAERAGMAHDLANARYLVGLADLGADRSQTALAELEQAEAGFAAVQDHQYQALTRLSLAEALHRRGRWDEARGLVERTLTDLEAGGWRPAAARARLQLLDWTTDAGAADRLLAQLEPAVSELRLPELSYAWRLREARRLRRTGQAAAAEDLLRQVVAEAELTSRALTSYAARTSFRRDRAAASDELIEALLSRRDDSAACAVSDAAKAQTLRELRSEALAGSYELTPPAEESSADAELNAAYADLNATYLALHDTGDPDSLAALREQAAQQEGQVARLRLRQTSGDLDETGLAPGPGPGAPGSSSDAGGHPVARHQVPALAYHVLGSDIVVFCCTRDGVTARRLVGAAPLVSDQLDELAALWLRTARLRTSPVPMRARRLEQLRASAEATLHELYRLVLAPVQDRWDDLVEPGENGASLLVVPHGLMGSVPFHALHDGNGYLAERFAITSLPTLGRPASPDPRARGDRRALVVEVRDEAIPAAAAEARAVAAALESSGVPVRRLSGDDAGTATVAAAMGDATTVHLISHGTFRPGTPLFSRLRLADGWITAGEVVGLRLPGSLVTLSACESGRHGQVGEPIGLGWAFLAAGAAGAVVSQWKVDDAVTADLMAAFYTAWRPGRSPADALRAAQLQIAASHPHPYYWAPFGYLASCSDPTSWPDHAAPHPDREGPR